MPNKTDDGKPDSYFVEYVLFDRDGEPFPDDFDTEDIITTKVALTKEQEEERLKRVKKAISERKKLKKEPKEITPPKPKETKAKTPKPKAKKESPDEVKLRLAEMRTSEINMLKGLLEQGAIDKETFVSLLKEVYSKYEKGGLI